MVVQLLLAALLIALVWFVLVHLGVPFWIVLLVVVAAVVLILARFVHL